ncbi:hypothetical protein [Streptomyces galbus]|uniref:hypothetical protein n=1 Tax=Streptomyces galbus TaxID=33898 RepID=UPI00144A8773|nr:hypothetical protein [Streptomyces galbus]
MGLPIQMWHSPNCPQWTIMQIGWEASSQRIREQDEWARGVFPAVRWRMRQAAAKVPPGTAAQPFVDALCELVQEQTGHGYIPLHRWPQILERHFPPELPDPGHTTA